MLSSKVTLQLTLSLSRRLLRCTQGNGRRRASTLVPGGIIDSDYIVKSKCLDFPDFKHLTVTEGVRGRFKGNWGNRTAYECAVTGYKLSHDEVFQLAANFGTSLQQMGLEKGDIVAVLLPNCPQYASIIHGMLMTGIVASPMSPALTPTEVAKMVGIAAPKAVVTFPQFLRVIRALQQTPAGASIKNVIIVGENQDGCHNFSDMVKTDSSGGKFLQGTGNFDGTQEPGMILWSSGTTGPPKGVVLTHNSLNSQLEMIISDITTEFIPGGETAVGLIPFFHVMGAVILCNTSLQIGAKVVTMPTFDPQMFTQVLKKHKMTVMHVAPPLIGFMAANPALTKDDFEQLNTIVSGGAPPQLHHINALFQKAGKYIFYQEAYGMTEVSGGSHVMPWATKNTKIGSAGPPTPGTFSKIIDVDSGVALPPNQRGEILVKGPNVMQGYLKNEEATKATIDPQGWLHTGDIGYYDDDGFFYVVDRLKELIKVKGMQVSPTELEGVIGGNKKVADVAVIGVPDDRAGELPRAYIVRRDPSLTQEELITFLSDKISEYKQLKGGIEFVDAIPKSPSGKILRKNILAAYIEQKLAK